MLVSRSKLGNPADRGQLCMLHKFHPQKTLVCLNIRPLKFLVQKEKEKNITLKLQISGAIQMSSEIFATRFMVTFIRYWAQRQES